MAIDKQNADLRIPHEIVGDASQLEIPREPSSVDAERERLEKQIAYFDRKIEALEAEGAEIDAGYASSVDDLREQNTRRADYLVEKVRTRISSARSSLRSSAVGSLLDSYSFQLLGGTGFAAFGDTPEDIDDIREGSDVATLQGVVRTVGEKAAFNSAEQIEDPFVRKMMNQMGTQALMFQYYSHNFKDEAEMNLLMSVPLMALGYRAAGPVGVFTGLKGSMNAAYASKAKSYQLRTMARSIESDIMATLLESNAFTNNKDPVWLAGQNFRAASAKDEYVGRQRGEFQNHINPPHETYARNYNMAYDYRAQYENLRSKQSAEQSRLWTDMFTALGGI